MSEEYENIAHYVHAKFNNDPKQMLVAYSGLISSMCDELFIDWYENINSLDIRQLLKNSYCKVKNSKYDGRCSIYVDVCKTDLKDTRGSKDYISYSFPFITLKNFSQDFADIGHKIQINVASFIIDDWQRHKNGVRTIYKYDPSIKVGENAVEETPQSTLINKDAYWLKKMKRRSEVEPYFLKKGELLANIHNDLECYECETTFGGSTKWTAFKAQDINGKFRGLYRLNSDIKVWRKGLNPQGSFFRHGRYKPGYPIIVSEGIANGYLGWRVLNEMKGQAQLVTAWYADNIVNVIKDILSLDYVNVEDIVFLGECDTKGKVGKSYHVAECIKEITGGRHKEIWPEFSNPSEYNNDLTDYYREFGYNAVKQLFSHI